MERDILCRGKAMNKDNWVIGNCVRIDTDKKSCQIAMKHGNVFSQSWKNIKFDTFGRFIGIYDKNQNPIFKDDFVSARFVMKYFDSWGNQSSKTIFIKGYIEIHDSSFCISSTLGLFPIISLPKESLVIEVLGNIFDEPELLSKTTAESKVIREIDGYTKQPIKHRGKSSINGKWLYGLYQEFETPSHKIIKVIHEKVVRSQEEAKKYEIIEKTLGSFTGRMDKLQNEIYEGDILKYNFFSDDRGSLLLVVWDSFECCFKFQCLAEDNFKYLLPSDINTSCIEKIGNLFDNPL